MRRTFAKLAALMLALTLVLSGCNLVDVDQLALIAQQREEVAETLSTVLVEYDGGTLTAQDVMPVFYSNYSYMSQIYSSMGYEVDTETVNSILEDAVQTELENRVIAAQFEERGLSLPVTEEEIAEEADTAYQTNYEYALEYASGDTDEERAANAELVLFTEGYTPEYMYNMMLSGYQADALQADVEAEVTEVTDEELQAAYDEKVAADEETYTESPTDIESDATDASSVICWRPEGYRAVKHVLVIPEDDVLQAVTDARDAVDAAEEELAALEEELAALTDDDAADEATTGAAADETTGAAGDETTGVTTDETTDAAGEATTDAAADETTDAAGDETTDETTDATGDAANDAASSDASDGTTDAEATDAPRTAEEIQADIDAKVAEIEQLEQAQAEAEAACLASVSGVTDEIYAQLEAGESFDDVMAAYGEDPGMQSEPSMTTGYYVSAESTTWDANFTAGAMALENVGDYSATPVISTSGVHIIYYYEDVPAGAVPLDEVRDALYDQTLETMREEHYTEQLAAWVEALNPVYHLDDWSFGE